MKVLVLGGNGFLGRVLVRQLSDSGWAQPIVASRRPALKDPRVTTLSVDTLDETALRHALTGMDAVVNCVAGDGASIAQGAQCLANAALAVGKPRLVHLSSMAVYGGREGLVHEATPPAVGLSWYGQAKVTAEAHARRYAEAGGGVVMLRPGCIAGHGAHEWVGRTAQWLSEGRLGDLGVAGDGHANLVDVEDVAQAAIRSLRLALPAGRAAVFNLAAPDSPRWNTYFMDLAMAIGAIPLKRVTSRELKREVYLRGVVLKALEKLLGRLKLDSAQLPHSMPPSLMRLWAQHIELDVHAATQQLGMDWTPYPRTLLRSAQWWLRVRQQ